MPTVEHCLGCSAGGAALVAAVMHWPYAFLTDLTDEQKAARRDSLSHYASLAHYYSFAPAVLFLLLRLVLRVKARIERRRRGRYSSIPGSPVSKAQRLTNLGDLKAKWTKAIWWLGEDVVLRGESWGQRDEWVFGFLYTLWLLALCVVGTGNGMSFLACSNVLPLL